MSTVIFTSSSLRHKAFASIAFNNRSLNLSKVFFEKGKPLEDLVEKKTDNFLEKKHLEARAIYEKDFFSLYLETQKNINKIVNYVPRGWFSSETCLKELKTLNPSQILVYGTSIIKGEIINHFKKRILNLHLGLSPYYRGAGTNYFPFVNKEPEYAGSTIMYLDSGIDTGEIIHQFRPEINISDSFHQLSNRFLVKSFKIYSLIAAKHLVNGLGKPSISSEIKNNKKLVYKKNDFCKKNIISLYDNFQNNMIENFLENKKNRYANTPILEQEFLK
tara:strand:- start:1277 stop:2101 length:825 start_codon:yes stop_codon:yes gene_type:complete